MRAIKLRAWDNGKMHQVGVCDCCNDLEDVAHMDAGHEMPLMEYTGLRDKHQVQIFDGDIVKQAGRLFRVERCTGGFECIEQHGGTYIFSILTHMGCEVIGNLYENPELLVRT